MNTFKSIKIFVVSAWIGSIYDFSIKLVRSWTPLGTMYQKDNWIGSGPCWCHICDLPVKTVTRFFPSKYLSFFIILSFLKKRFEKPEEKKKSNLKASNPNSLPTRSRPRLPSFSVHRIAGNNCFESFSNDVFTIEYVFVCYWR